MTSQAKPTTSTEEPVGQAISKLQRLSDLFIQRREQLAAEAGISVGQWRVLEEIASEHFMPSLFARRRSVSPAAVSKLIRGLLDRDLVAVEIAAADARQRSYLLTRQGLRTLEAMRRSRQRAIDRVWAGLPENELKRFARFAEKLSDRLEAYSDEEKRRT